MHPLIQRYQSLVTFQQAIKKPATLHPASKSTSFSFHRIFSQRLHVEALESRALLTGLIAAVDIAPVPVEEFTVQAKSFIESALDQVMQSQHQTPIGSTVESSQELASDGSLIRVTNYTVELTSIVDSDMTIGLNTSSLDALRGESIQGNSATPPSLLSSSSAGTTFQPHSQLVFSFEIFADNSISVRARLTNPQLVGYMRPSLHESHSLRDASPRTDDNGSADDRTATASTQSSRLESRSVRGSGRAGTSAIDASSNDGSSRQDQADKSTSELGKRTRSDLIANLPLRIGSKAPLDPLGIHDDTESVLAPVENQAGDSLWLSTPTNNLVMLNLGIGESEASCTEATSILLSMLHLEFASTSEPAANLISVDRVETLRSSALYQVFLHSPGDDYYAGLDAEMPTGNEMVGTRAGESSGFQFDRWQRASIALLALAGGLFVRVPQRRLRQQNSEIQFS